MSKVTYSFTWMNSEVSSSQLQWTFSTWMLDPWCWGLIQYWVSWYGFSVRSLVASSYTSERNDWCDSSSWCLCYFSIVNTSIISSSCFSVNGQYCLKVKIIFTEMTIWTSLSRPWWSPTHICWDQGQVTGLINSEGILWLCCRTVL